MQVLLGSAQSGSPELVGPDGEVDLDRAYALPPAGTRHLRANFITSADGAIAFRGVSGPLGGPGDRRLFSVLRGLTDAVLVGVGTVRAENYGPARVTPERAERRVAAGLPPLPTIAVMTSRLDIDLDARLFRENPQAPRPVLLTTERSDPSLRRAAAEVADVVVSPSARLSVHGALDALHARGLSRVLCEGGPTLLTSAVHEQAVDELCLTVGAVLAGPDNPRMASGAAFDMPAPLRLRHVLEEDGLLFLRYGLTTAPGPAA